MSRSKALSVEVLPPSKSATVALFGKEEAAIARQIVADHDACERHSRLAAFAALRNGIRLVWVRDNSEHGTLDPFMKAYLPDKSRASCFNYLRMADQFLADCGFKDKTHKLTNGAKVEPLIDKKLEIFADDSRRHEGAVAKMVRWVGDRGLTQIYRDLSAEETTHNLKGGARVKKKTAADERKEHQAAALQALNDTILFREMKHWQLFDEGDMARLVNELKGFLDDAAAFVKAAKAAQPHKWKGAAKS